MLGEVLIERGRRAEAREPLLTLDRAYNEGRFDEKDGQSSRWSGARPTSCAPRATPTRRSGRPKRAAWRHAAPALARRAVPREVRPGSRRGGAGRGARAAPNDPDALVWWRTCGSIRRSTSTRPSGWRARCRNPKPPAAYFVLAGIALRDMELELAEKHIAEGLAIDPAIWLLSLRAAVRFVAATGGVRG